MGARVKAFLVLWKMGRISEAALRQAVSDGTLAEEEFNTIVGK